MFNTVDGEDCTEIENGDVSKENGFYFVTCHDGFVSDTGLTYTCENGKLLYGKEESICKPSMFYFVIYKIIFRIYGAAYNPVKMVLNFVFFCLLHKSYKHLYVRAQQINWCTFLKMSEVTLCTAEENDIGKLKFKITVLYITSVLVLP